MADSMTLYKLMILYMLRKVNFPLSNAQITEFMIDKNYTDYFHVQEAIHDLLDASLISETTIRNTSQYEATDEGERTLEYFGSTISDAIKLEIDDYLRDNSYEIRNESATRADYVRTERGDYAVRCFVHEGPEVLIDLTFTVPTEEDAGRVCANWPEKSQDIYMHILRKLLGVDF